MERHCRTAPIYMPPPGVCITIPVGVSSAPSSPRLIRTLHRYISRPPRLRRLPFLETTRNRRSRRRQAPGCDDQPRLSCIRAWDPFMLVVLHLCLPSLNGLPGPGRHFAAIELKAILTHIVLNFDIKLQEEGVRPANQYIASACLPHSSAKVMFRKRA
jgi:hypothetical protein